MAKRISDAEQKKLLQLFENSKSNNDDEVDAYYNYLEEIGINPDEVNEYLAVKNQPETEQEKRISRKDKAANDWSTEGAIDIADVSKAYNAPIAEDSYRTGALSKYLKNNGVFSPVKGESNEEFVSRNRNAFEKMGLNWDNSKDRELVAKSIGLASQQDSREAIKEEKNSGILGFLSNVAFPRMNEHADRDIMAGEETDGYLKDFALDAGEDILMTLGAPMTGALKAVSGLKSVDKAYKSFKKGKKILDKRTKANKVLQGVGSLAGYVGDNAAVPLVTEAMDAAAYNDESNPRSDFSSEDVGVGTAVNMVAPVRTARQGGRLMMYLPGLKEAGEKIVSKIDTRPIMKYAEPYITNKAGKSEYVKSLPIASSIETDRAKDVKEMQKKADDLAARKEEWKMGMHIPTSPKDKYWDEFVKFAKERSAKGGVFGKYL